LALTTCSFFPASLTNYALENILFSPAIFSRCIAHLLYSFLGQAKNMQKKVTNKNRNISIFCGLIIKMFPFCCHAFCEFLNAIFFVSVS